MNLSIKALAGLSCFAVLFFSCQKDIGPKEHIANVGNSVAADATVAGEFPTCKLRRVVHEHPGISGLIDNGLFTYNSAGNPISLLFYHGGTGNPNHYFYYDKKNRLREWRAAYSPDDHLEAVWHRYGYNEKDQIVEDTLLNGHGVLENGQPSMSPLIFSTITYDDKGRVIKEVVRWQGRPTRYPTYTYDARGNLGVNGWKSSWYDNKVSFLRSNPIFMFLCRNYSMNNALNPTASTPVRKYNSKGLPLSVTPGNFTFFTGAKNMEKLIYDCE